MKGYLTWKGTERGIAWNPDAASDDNVDPYPNMLPYDGRQGIGIAEQYLIGTYDPTPRTPFEFTSAKVPQTLHVNVSRLLKVNLYVKQCAVDFDIEVSLDGKIIAGGVREPYGYDTALQRGSADPEDEPAQGSGYCLYQQRVPMEVHEIPAGSTIKVRFIEVRQQGGYPIGFAGTHWSHISIPVYNEDEYLYRVGGNPIRNPGVTGAPEADTGAFMGLLLGVLLMGRRRPGSQAVAVGSLLLTSLAGCLGSDGGSGDAGAETTGTHFGGSGTQTFEPVPDPGRGVGSIVGHVEDHLSAPVAQVHISLVKTNLFKDTDAQGGYILRDVPPGDYTVRAVKDGFKVFEGTVQVKADHSTRYDIRLEPIVVKENEFDRHRHDYWAGKNQKPLLSEEPVGMMKCDWQAFSVFNSRCALVSFRLQPAANAEAFNTILPGTAYVDVTVTWPQTGADELQRVALAYQTPHDGLYFTNMLYPRASGVPFHIATNWDMTDVGHERLSQWNFMLFSPYSDLSHATVAKSTAVPFGPFEVTMTLKRGGIMPLGPAHIEFWGTSTSRIILQEEDILTTTPGWSPSSLVPPQTEWLELVLKQERAMDVGQWDYGLRYKPGPTRDFCTPTNVQSGPEPTTAPLTWTWRLKVEAGEADPFYATQSRWCFLTYPTGNTYQNLAAFYAYHARNGFAIIPGADLIMLNMTITAYRTPMPAGAP